MYNYLVLEQNHNKLWNLYFHTYIYTNILFNIFHGITLIVEHSKNNADYTFKFLQFLLSHIFNKISKEKLTFLLMNSTHLKIASNGLFKKYKKSTDWISFDDKIIWKSSLSKEKKSIFFPSRVKSIDTSYRV